MVLHGAYSRILCVRHRSALDDPLSRGQNVVSVTSWTSYPLSVTLGHSA